MSETLNDLILDSLSQPMPAIGYYLNRRLRALYPDKAIVEGFMAHFNVEAYAAEGRCELRERAVPQPERILHWVNHEQMASIEELPSDPGYSDQMIHPAGMVRRGLVGRRSGPMHDGPYPGDVPM